MDHTRVRKMAPGVYKGIFLGQSRRVPPISERKGVSVCARVRVCVRAAGSALPVAASRCKNKKVPIYP